MRQPEGREVVIVEAVRTPIGRGHREKGYYKDTHPNTLLGHCYTEVISRAGVEAGERGLHRLAGALGGAVGAGKQQHGTVVGCGRRHTAGDSAASGYCESLLHAWSLLAVCFTGRFSTVSAPCCVLPRCVLPGCVGPRE